MGLFFGCGILGFGVLGAFGVLGFCDFVIWVEKETRFKILDRSLKYFLSVRLENRILEFGIPKHQFPQCHGFLKFGILEFGILRF